MNSAGTENRIAVERKRYNDTLRDYNTYVQQFPNNLFAAWRIQAERSVLRSFGRIARGSEGKLLEPGRNRSADKSSACASALAQKRRSRASIRERIKTAISGGDRRSRFRPM